MNLPQAFQKARTCNGFTLPELLLVIVISTVIFAFAIPVSLNFYRHQLVDDTSRLLVESLRRARSSAIAGRADSAFGVRVFSASNTLVLFQGESYAGRNSAEDEVIDFPRPIAITGSSTEVTFSKIYGTSTINETWSVSFDAISSNISINSQGLVELE